MEDGCSKRFDIETVDFRPQSYSNGDQGSARITSQASELPSRQESYSSSHYSSPTGSSTSLGPHDSSLTSASGPYLERHDYMGGGESQGAVWSN